MLDMFGLQPNNPTSQQISMQAAVLRPFPAVPEVRPPSRSREETLDLIIQNLESHHRDVKSSILAQSLAATSQLPTDPRLVHRAQHSTSSPSPTQDALLASLVNPLCPSLHPSNPIIPLAAQSVKEDRFFGVVEETLRMLTEYERRGEAAVGRWKVEREKLKELKRLEMDREERERREKEERERREREGAMDWTREPVVAELGKQKEKEKEKAGEYDAARDPRLRR